MKCARSEHTWIYKWSFFDHSIRTLSSICGRPLWIHLLWPKSIHRVLMNFVISSVLNRSMAKIQHRIDSLQSNDVSANISCSCRCEMWNQILFFPSAVTNTHFEMPIHRLLGCWTAAVFPRRAHAVGVFIRSRQRAGTYTGEWATITIST